MEHSHISILLLIVGIALLVAELFLPSGGMITILAVLAFTVSMWAAWTAWWDTARVFWWTYLASLIVLLPTAVVIALNVFPKTKLGKRVLLEAPSLEKVTPYLDETKKLEALIGSTGTTLSLLNPGGLVLVDGERMHSESEGMMIDPKTAVDVVGVDGTRLIVRQATSEKVDPQIVAQENQNPEVSDSEQNHDPLDFDIPQS